MTPVPLGPLALLDVDHLLSDQERAVQRSVRRLVDDTIRPNIVGLYEEGTFPAEMARSFGKLGLLGMHLRGYGCAGMSAVEYGLACMEEAGDSGARSFASVQGSLAMFAIHHWAPRSRSSGGCPRWPAVRSSAALA
jgi:glutaryl-CoA dehydrogenase